MLRRLLGLSVWQNRQHKSAQSRRMMSGRGLSENLQAGIAPQRQQDVDEKQVISGTNLKCATPEPHSSPLSWLCEEQCIPKSCTKTPLTKALHCLH